MRVCTAGQGRWCGARVGYIARHKKHEMKTAQLFTVLFLLALDCMAQDKIRPNALSLSVGPGHLARQDLIFSPTIHRDFTGLNFGLEYTRQAKLFQKASLRYGSFNPMVIPSYEFNIHGEEQTAYPHSFNLLDVDYLLGK